MHTLAAQGREQKRKACINFTQMNLFSKWYCNGNTLPHNWNLWTSYVRGSQTFSQKGRMRLQCNLKGPELFLEGGGGVKICARSPLRPGSRAHSRALEALGLLMLSDAISALFWTIYNLFETFFITFTAIFYALYFMQL